MTIDEDTAWPAVLAARRAWRQAARPAPLALDLPGGGALRLAPDGRFESARPVSAAAASLLELFAPLAAAPRLVIAQLGQSLDGRIATPTGRSHYINGADGLRHLHRLRALVDAVVVGAGTVAADDPQLTVRHCAGDNPVRVVIDPRGRLPATHRVFRDGQAPSLVVRSRAATSTPPAPALELADDGGDIAPHRILEALAARGLARVLVEGGAQTVSRFLAARALDRLHVVVAPLIIGSGRVAVELPPIDTLDAALRAPVRHIPLGTDMLFDLHLT